MRRVDGEGVCRIACGICVILRPGSRRSDRVCGWHWHPSRCPGRTADGDVDCSQCQMGLEDRVPNRHRRRTCDVEHEHPLRQLRRWTVASKRTRVRWRFVHAFVLYSAFSCTASGRVTVVILSFRHCCSRRCSHGVTVLILSSRHRAALTTGLQCSCEQPATQSAFAASPTMSPTPTTESCARSTCEGPAVSTAR
jgi:hypothetical protein